jgi:5-methylcytosine-specific restriction endonuclease McrA
MNDNHELRRKRMELANLKGTHTKEEWYEMKLFFGICVRCEGKSNLIVLGQDHIIPVYQGGSNSIKNIQPLCARCNSSKGPENIDYRITYAKKHNLQLKKEWL